MILGAGGAAAAVLRVLLEEGASSIYICNRNTARAGKLRDATSGEQQEKLRLVKWEERQRWLHMRPVTMIVNTTSAGMSPQQNSSPLPAAVLYAGMTVIDLIYNPIETVLLHDANKVGARTLNGLPMLIHQGVAALEMWSRQKLEIGGIYGDLEKHLLAQMRNE
jgi:shikimate dehydrogenase